MKPLVCQSFSKFTKHVEAYRYISYILRVQLLAEKYPKAGSYVIYPGLLTTISTLCCVEIPAHLELD